MDMDEKAIIVGTQLRGDRFRAGILIRHYGAGYRSQHAGAFSAFGKTSNEKGVYTSFQADITRSIRFIAAMDLARKQVPARIPVDNRRQEASDSRFSRYI
ncbi:hypothetical protein ES708_31777 [subsurface metagenome]